MNNGGPQLVPNDFPIDLQEALFPGSLKVLKAHNSNLPILNRKSFLNWAPYSGQTFVLNVCFANIYSSRAMNRYPMPGYHALKLCYKIFKRIVVQL